MTDASISFDDAAFHLEYVPEGTFTLQVSGAKDLTKVQVENPVGYTPRFHEESKTVKTYGRCGAGAGGEGGCVGCDRGGTGGWEGNDRDTLAPGYFGLSRRAPLRAVLDGFAVRDLA